MVSAVSDLPKEPDILENAKRSKNGDIILGNTTFRYIPEKTYTKIDKDIAADVAEQLEKQGIKFSGVIKGDTATITVSKPQKEALDKIIADISSHDNDVRLAQSEFIEIASNILSADETVFNAHRYSDEQNYRLEINNGIDRIFTEAIMDNRDIGYSVSEMSQLWSEFQSNSSVKENIQTTVADNVDITLTANEQQIEKARQSAKEQGIPFSEDYSGGADEEFNPYVFDGSMSPEDFRKMQLLNKLAEITNTDNDTPYRLIEAFDRAARPDWENNLQKQRQIKRALYDILGDTEQTEKAFACIADMKYNVKFTNEKSTPTVADLAVGDVILYDGKRREVEQIDEKRISLKDLDSPNFDGILLGTSDVYAYAGWQEDMNNKGFEILSKAEKNKKAISFSSLDFEKKIPNEMRWKENSIVEDNTALYWVTQEIFTEADLDKFQAALKDTDIEKAYVIPRDLSGYSFEDDMANNAPFAVVTKDSISCKDYIDKIKSVYNYDVSKQHEYDPKEAEITRDMYQTENPDVLVIKGRGSLAKIDISVNEELWNRLAEKGLVRNENSVDRLLYETDNINWNKLVIPDKWGNMTNNISIEDVLTREELLTAKSVADFVIKPEYSVDIEPEVEAANEIQWTPISETEDEKGRPTSYSTEYNGKLYWISENADGRYDIETKVGDRIVTLGEEYSDFPTRDYAESAFDDYIEDMEQSFLSDKQALISVEIFGEEHYFKISDSSVDDILKTANTEKPLLKFTEIGEKISGEEYAEIQQSDSFTYSVEMNLDNDTASIYTVNDGNGGISEADRTNSNVTFDTVKISDYSGQAIEERIAADNLPDTKFTSLSDEARMYLDFHQYVPYPEATPWGETQSCYEINKGIFDVTTAGHGGIMIRSDIADKILSPEARKIGFREKGFHCFEEDCDIAVAYRELTDKKLFRDMNNFFEEWYGSSYEEKFEQFSNTTDEIIKRWFPDYWDKREQAIFNARPEEEQAAITGQMSLFGDIPDLEDFPDFTEEENISDNTVNEPVEKSDSSQSEKILL